MMKERDVLGGWDFEKLIYKALLFFPSVRGFTALKRSYVASIHEHTLRAQTITFDAKGVL